MIIPQFAMSKNNDRLRRFCVTWNNYPSNAIETLLEFASKKLALYAIFGRESGETGTPHIQGYLHLKHAVTFSAFKKQFLDMETCASAS